MTSQNSQSKDDYSIEHMILYCEQSGIDSTPENLRFINQTIRDPDYLIPYKAWKLLQEVGGDLTKYVEK